MQTNYILRNPDSGICDLRRKRAVIPKEPTDIDKYIEIIKKILKRFKCGHA